MIVYYFCIAIICHIAYSEDNVTNATTTTEGPDTSTTEFYSTTTSTTGVPTLTGAPTLTTLGPTTQPTDSPTTAPSQQPTPGCNTCLISLVCTFTGNFSKNWEEENADLLTQLVIDSANINDGIECIIWKIIYIYGPAPTPGRRLLADVIIGIEIEFRLKTDNPEIFNEFKASIDSGDFGEEFQEGLTDNFEDVKIDQSSIGIERDDDEDADVFLGIEKETFGEKMESPYILLGLVCIIVGTVWLIFLRSNIEYKPPTYFTQQARDGGVGDTQGNNAVEMQKIASSASD